MTVRIATLENGMTTRSGLRRCAAGAAGMATGYPVWLVAMMMVVAMLPVQAWAAAGVTGLPLLAAAAFLLRGWLG